MNYFSFVKSRKGRKFPKNCVLILFFESYNYHFERKYYPNFWDDVFADIAKWDKDLYKDLKSGDVVLHSFRIRKQR